jgi:hypothetical protein
MSDVDWELLRTPGFDRMTVQQRAELRQHLQQRADEKMAIDRRLTALEEKVKRQGELISAKQPAQSAKPKGGEKK